MNDSGSYEGEVPGNGATNNIAKRWFWWLVASWTVMIGLSLAWNHHHEKNELRLFIGNELSSLVQYIIVSRLWNAKHGGVYAVISEKSPPNPYLAGLVDERDITTPEGKKLTLINPAYMTRQLNEILKDHSNLQAHITSLKPIRPENAPDAWETKALKLFEKGDKELLEQVEMDGKAHMRLMRPLLTENSCLQCHASQGYKEGDIRGGISVTRPMGRHIAFSDDAMKIILAAHLLLWLLGLAGIQIATRKMQLHELEKADVNRRIHESLKSSLESTVSAVSKAVEARDPYTAGHQLKVAKLATAIAHEIGMDLDRIEGVRIGASIHDIGKIQLPAEILTKPSILSDIEYSLIKTHTEVGYKIFKDIDFPWPVANIIHQHHERLDGSGYPQGLRGNEICLEARIVAVADTVDSMSSHRPYRPSLGIKKALDEIKEYRGKHYDPEVVDACLKLFAENRFSFENK